MPIKGNQRCYHHIEFPGCNGIPGAVFGFRNTVLVFDERSMSGYEAFKGQAVWVRNYAWQITLFTEAMDQMTQRFRVNLTVAGYVKGNSGGFSKA